VFDSSNPDHYSVHLGLYARPVRLTSPSSPERISSKPSYLSPQSLPARPSERPVAVQGSQSVSRFQGNLPFPLFPLRGTVRAFDHRSRVAYLFLRLSALECLNIPADCMT
jgi:hypothetical protein